MIRTTDLAEQYLLPKVLIPLNSGRDTDSGDHILLSIHVVKEYGSGFFRHYQGSHTSACFFECVILLDNLVVTEAKAGVFSGM